MESLSRFIGGIAAVPQYISSNIHIKDGSHKSVKKYEGKVVVGMVPMVLGELYISFSLRGDEENIGGRQKKREILEDCSRRKSSISFLI
jgi:hypothetical protein